MQVIVGKDLRIIDAPKQLCSWARESLVLDNPDYYKKLNRGLWLGNTPRTLNLFSQIGSTLVLPFGCLQKIYTRYPDASYELEFCSIRPFNYKSGINLYQYQREAVSAALVHKNGILVMPCGSGKTQCGIEIISRVGGRALWLTHTADLLNQSKERAQSVLECDKSAFGTITAGKINISEGITFATVQTMAKIDLMAYSDVWDIIIVDECQHCAGSPTRVSQFYKVVSNLSARYKIGLTATPYRSDGLQDSMFALLGGIMHEITLEQVAHNTCPVRVIMEYTKYMPDITNICDTDGTIDYSKLIHDLVSNAERFDCVYKRIIDVAESGATLVLANRVEYLQRLCELFNKKYKGQGVCLSANGVRKKAKEERKNALKQLNDGTIKCIFATYQLAKEGLDVPNLRYVVLATPEKDQTTVMQSAGRVGRKAEGKNIGTVIDFVDEFRMYQEWARKRIGYYKRLSYEIY